MDHNTWQFVWTFIVQPIILFGLFTMTFFSLVIAIRAFKKQLRKDEEEIHHNSDQIKNLYKVVGEHLKASKELEKTIKENEKEVDYW